VVCCLHFVDFSVHNNLLKLVPLYLPLYDLARCVFGYDSDLESGRSRFLVVHIFGKQSQCEL